MNPVHFSFHLGSGKKRAPAKTPFFKAAGPAAIASPAAKPVVDIAAYPVLTEEVGFSPSPLARTAGSGLPAGMTPGGSSLGQMVTKAVSDVLGWKVKAGDAKGFVGALTQSFAVTEVAGHIESKWTPRTYAVQTDLNGGITGAQASVYSRAKVALEQSLPLLDGLYKLDPEAPDEDVAALKAVVKSQLTEMVNEMAFLGGPRIARVNQYFSLLLGTNAYPLTPTPSQQLTITDPDTISGTLGGLRDLLALNFKTQAYIFVNSVQDETNLSNYRVISDYVTSLAQSWLNNVGYMYLNTKTPFFGTQLVLLSRQLSVVAETVDEVRFTLDSVFVGPAERQTLELTFPGTPYAPIFLEDLLSWIQNFATEEGPRLIQDGGKFGVSNTFTQVAKQLEDILHLIPSSSARFPQGFSTQRVQLSFDDLRDQMRQLVRLAAPIQQVITPQPDFGVLPVTINSISPNPISSTASPSPSGLYILGSGFVNGPNLGATISPSARQFPVPSPSPLNSVNLYFTSDGVLYVTFSPTLGSSNIGYYDISLTNGDGRTAGPLVRGLQIT